MSTQHNVTPDTINRFSARQWLTVGIIVLVLSILAVVVVVKVRGERSLRWTEDVQLPDGRVVTLTRYQAFRDANYDPGDYWFEFTNPATRERIRFESTRGVGPVSLLADGEDFLLLTTFPYGMVSYLGYDCPNPPYILKRFRQGFWVDVELTKSPQKVIAANLTTSIVDAVEKIKSSNYYLNVAQTKNQSLNLTPYVVDLTLMGQQTFGNRNCSSARNYLLRKDLNEAVK